jgi:hypothetical protein
VSTDSLISQAGVSGPQETPPRLSAAGRFNVLELHEQGLSVRAIALETGFSKSAVDRAVHAGARRANRAAALEGDAESVAAHRRRLAAERQARKRKRDRKAALAARTPSAVVARRENPAPVALAGDIEEHRPVKVWTATAGAGSRSLVDMRTGQDIRVHGAEHRSRRNSQRDHGLIGMLNRRDAEREQRARNLRDGLSDNGLASVAVLCGDTGRKLYSTSYDPLDSTDVARASGLTGVPEAVLLDSSRRTELRAGVTLESFAGDV